MAAVLEFLSLRLLVIGAVVAVGIVVVFVVVAMLKKTNRLGQARDFVEPIARSYAKRKGGYHEGIANFALDRISGKVDEHRSGTNGRESE